MSRKDYIAMAAALREVRRAVEANPEVTAQETVHLVAVALAGVLRSDNPRFDTDRFLAAVEGK